jgi:hypothetical protein
MYDYGLIVVICPRKGGVGARAYNEGITVKMSRMGANMPHFLRSTFGTTISSKVMHFVFHIMGNLLFTILPPLCFKLLIIKFE